MNSENNKNSRVWFITGTSGGIGRELVREVLRCGDSVVATSRNPQKVAEVFPEHNDQLLAVAVDLGNFNQITKAVQAGISRFGKIDVLVNNAGYGLIGAVEEADDDEVSRVHEVNVMGLLRVLRAVLPHFRERKSGHVVNLSSIGGLVGLPGFGIYNATKFAVEGISEALAAEVAPLGIKVTVVEPGPFRTEFLAGSLAMAKNVMPQYEGTAGVTRAGAVRLLQEQWSGRRIVELEGPKRVTPNEIAATFARLLGRPVRAEIVPHESWETLFKSQGMKNPIPRIRMLEGFNEGWIEFERGEAGSQKGSIALEAVLKALVETEM